VNVVDVEFQRARVTVTVALKRRRLRCPHCDFSTAARYDTRKQASSRRHLDLGTWPLELRATLRRLACPTHGVVVEAVPFARPGVHFTRDLDDLVAWLAARMDATAVARLCSVS
ncbi:MAG: transposase family protein, partial [Actinobacteria bacterium]|nr:transposase family protein [Actinomycetota bacterium]